MQLHGFSTCPRRHRREVAAQFHSFLISALDGGASLNHTVTHSGPRRFMGKETFSCSYKNSNPGPSSQYTSHYAALAPSVLLSRVGNKLKQQYSLTCACTRNSKPCRIAHKPGEVQLYHSFFSSNGGERTWKFMGKSSLSCPQQQTFVPFRYPFSTSPPPFSSQC